MENEAFKCRQAQSFSQVVGPFASPIVDCPCSLKLCTLMLVQFYRHCRNLLNEETKKGLTKLTMSKPLTPNTADQILTVFSLVNALTMTTVGVEFRIAFLSSAHFQKGMSHTRE